MGSSINVFRHKTSFFSLIREHFSQKVKMSSRPTRSSRRHCESSKTSNSAPKVIIGDTCHSVVKAHRLLKDGVTQPIAILLEGNDDLNESAVQKTDFTPRHSRVMLSYLKAEVLHYISRGNDNNASDGIHPDEDEDEEQVVNYYHGNGVCGDFVSSYFVPRMGPWFSNRNHSDLKSFVRKHTDKTCMSSVERQLASTIANEFEIDQSSEFLVNNPTVMNALYSFVDGEHDRDQDISYRQLFLRMLNDVYEASNVTFYLRCTGMKFARAGKNTYDVEFESCGDPQAISGANVFWETNPYTFLRLATLGGLRPRSVRVPVAYRAVVPIPLQTSVINLESQKQIGDLVTTYIPFTLQDIKSGDRRGCSIAWYGNVYTTVEDLSTTGREGLYAERGKTLLIIEAISLINRRTACFDSLENQVNVEFNTRKAERAWLNRFCEIVSKIYRAYTGITVDPSSIAKVESLCQSGMCTDQFQISNIALRESPMWTILELCNHLYGSDTWLVAGSNRC